MESFLFHAPLVAMDDAFYSDHQAAVVKSATNCRETPKQIAFFGAIRVMGHSTTLFIISIHVILTERLAARLEIAIGILLIGLAQVGAGTAGLPHPVISRIV